MNNKRDKYTSKLQLEAMVDLIKLNRDVACGFSQRAPAEIKKFWEDLALTLNGSGPPLKDGSGWRKVWTDYKSGVKKKLIPTYSLSFMCNTSSDLYLKTLLSTRRSKQSSSLLLSKNAMVTFVKADMWKLPTAQDLQTAMDTCQLPYQYFINAHEENRTDSSEDIRCFAQELELWSDHDGFQIERFVKLLSKHNASQEIEVVMDYCNNSRKQTDLVKWANEAYACFSQGRLGLWIIEYIESAYKKKNNNV